MAEEKKNSKTMGSTGVRFTDDQLEQMDRWCAKLGIAKRNVFIRDAVDFYIEWLERDKAERFITPALESVLDGKLKDTEGRLARILFKLAVTQNMAAHIMTEEYDWEACTVEELRLRCIRELKETNGTINLENYMRKD